MITIKIIIVELVLFSWFMTYINYKYYHLTEKIWKNSDEMIKLWIEMMLDSIKLSSNNHKLEKENSRLKQEILKNKHK